MYRAQQRAIIGHRRGRLDQGGGFEERLRTLHEDLFGGNLDTTTRRLETRLLISPVRALHSINEDRSVGTRKEAVADELDISVVIITRNEEDAIGPCIASVVDRVKQVLIVDSGSTDATVERAELCGAEVLDFVWNGAYPKKKEWSLHHPSVSCDWVLLLDADERLTDELYAEIRDELPAWEAAGVAGVETPLHQFWLGKPLRHGYMIRKHTLLNRKRARFPDVGDEDAPGITEVEGHYQPLLDGALVRSSGGIVHDDPDPFADWIARHNRYSDWEAHIALRPAQRDTIANDRSSRGRVFYRLPLKPILFFAYSYIAKLGALDGRAGFDYALAYAMYYWMTGVKVRELRQQSNRQT